VNDFFYVLITLKIHYVFVFVNVNKYILIMKIFREIDHTIVINTTRDTHLCK